MSSFFTNEQVSLEKDVETKAISQNSIKKIHEIYEIDRCETWIKTNNYRRVNSQICDNLNFHYRFLLFQVCLQFPDHLLPDSVEVAFTLQEALHQPVYLMGDTAYERYVINHIFFNWILWKEQKIETL